jgi:hypothetical protein
MTPVDASERMDEQRAVPSVVFEGEVLIVKSAAGNGRIELIDLWQRTSSLMIGLLTA